MEMCFAIDKELYNINVDVVEDEEMCNLRSSGSDSDSQMPKDLNSCTTLQSMKCQRTMQKGISGPK